MSLYRRTHVKMWASADFRSLSRAQPNAQTLFQYLITGDHTGVIPGVICIGRAALGEALGWTADDVTALFEELSRRGMAVADWDARLVYLPAALAHNMPSNPNQVLAWRNTWALVPACPLRDRIESEMAAQLPKFADAVARAFNRSPNDWGNDSPNGYVNHSGNGSDNGSAGRSDNGCCGDCKLPKSTDSQGFNGSRNGSANASSRTCACAYPAPAPAPAPAPGSGSQGVQGERVRPPPPVLSDLAAEILAAAAKHPRLIPLVDAAFANELALVATTAGVPHLVGKALAEVAGELAARNVTDHGAARSTIARWVRRAKPEPSERAGPRRAGAPVLQPGAGKSWASTAIDPLAPPKASTT